MGADVSRLTLIKTFFCFPFDPLHDPYRTNSTRRKFLRNQAATQRWSHSAAPLSRRDFSSRRDNIQLPQQHGATRWRISLSGHWFLPLYRNDVGNNQESINCGTTPDNKVAIIHREGLLKYSINNYTFRAEVIKSWHLLLPEQLALRIPEFIKEAAYALN